MMKVLITFICGMFSVLYLGAQGENSTYCWADHGIAPPTLKSNSCNPNKLASYGRNITPHGDVTILYIFAGFDYVETEENLQLGNQDIEGWPIELLQNPDESPAAAGTGIPDWMTNADPAENLFLSDFSQFATVDLDNSTSVSAFYYHTSMGKLRIIAKPFSDENGIPVRVNVDPTGVSGWSSMNKKVLEQLAVVNPNFDYGPFDQRENRPNFNFDNSIENADGTPASGDNKVDYIIISYRYSSSYIQPIANMNTWTYTSGGVDSPLASGSIVHNGYKVNDVGHTVIQFKGEPITMSLTVHEMGHVFFRSPHYFGANDVIGDRFNYAANGYGTSTIDRRMTQLGNSFERWLLDWQDPIHIDTESDLTNSGLYTLQDYGKSGDAIRVRIPGSDDQYLWIENHQKVLSMDESIYKGSIPGGANSDDNAELAGLEKGVYMYVENMTDDRSCWSGQDCRGNINGAMMLHANGKYDYQRASDEVDRNSYFFNFYPLEEMDANPISGIHPFMAYKDDFLREVNDANGDLLEVFPGDGEIFINSAINGLWGAYNEMTAIIQEKVDGVPRSTFRHWSGRNHIAAEHYRSDAFIVGDKIGMGTNPTILKYPIFDSEEEDFVFTGLTTSNSQSHKLPRGNDFDLLLRPEQFSGAADYNKYI